MVVWTSSKGQQPQVNDQAVEFGKQKSSVASSRSHSANSEKSQASSDKASSSAGGSGSKKSTPSRSSKGTLLRRLVTGVSANIGASQTGSAGSGKPRSSTEHSVSSMDLGG